MPRSYRYLHYDVFTDRLFGGNPLAVFLDGRGLQGETMLAIAKEMNFSETTFVLPAERPDTDVRLRIFTPRAELPMAGHPTVGSAFALARSGVVTSERDRIVVGLGVGPTPVSLVWNGPDLAFVWMSQAPATFGQPIGDRAGVAAMLGLSEVAVAGTGLPVQIVSCGVPFLLVPLATRAAVDNAALQIDRYETFKHASKAGFTGIFLFSPEPGGDRASAYSRMFAPDAGIAEDPATGSASGPLGCYLVRHRVVPPHRAGSILSLQGVKMGRTSAVHVSVGLDGEVVTAVRVGGEAALAGEGTLYV
ncbi:MAG: PhzF family phenazine biosynthesis protein [Acidobacteria bacterium]|nr:PhzF family phenazine biosynthesis protein [Acidobacteriota bacterium]